MLAWDLWHSIYNCKLCTAFGINREAKKLDSILNNNVKHTHQTSVRHYKYYVNTSGRRIDPHFEKWSFFY